MRNNIMKLIESGVTAHRVANDTGLPRNTVYRIFTGEAKLDNVTLKNAEVLNNYYLKIKGLLEMEKIMVEIREKFLVDGEDAMYATLHESKESLLEEIDRETFEDKFNVDVDKLNFPVITFDRQSDADGWIYEADHDNEDILYDAEQYFTKK